MRLSKYNCEQVGLRTTIPFTSGSWHKMESFLSASRKPGHKKSDVSRTLYFILDSSDKGSDYHLHFRARRSAKKAGATIFLDISHHVSGAPKNVRPKVKSIHTSELEAFLAELTAKRHLKLEWMARFIFSRRTFAPVFPMPFKSPFQIPEQANLLGTVSITGLKLETTKSPAGSGSIYFEAFPKMISIGTFFNHKTVIAIGSTEDFLKYAANVAALLVKKEPKIEKD